MLAILRWRLILALALVVASVAILGCDPADPNSYSPKEILEQPEAALVPPETEQYAKREDRGTNLVQAGVHLHYRSHESKEDIYQYYLKNLSDLGWTRSAAGEPTYQFGKDINFQNPTSVFEIRITFLDPSLLADPRNATGWENLFQYSIIQFGPKP